MIVDVEDLRDYCRSIYAESPDYDSLERFLAAADDPRPLRNRRALRLADGVSETLGKLFAPPADAAQITAALAREVVSLYEQAGMASRFPETVRAWSEVGSPDDDPGSGAKRILKLLDSVVTDARSSSTLSDAFRGRSKAKEMSLHLGELFDNTPLAGEMAAVVRQAIVLLSQLNAHLPFKRARYAIDPVQRLRLIAEQIPAVTERQFHRGMIETFKELRDAHTFYSLPRPYRGHVAFLPFLLEDCAGETAGGPRRYLVTKILPGFPSTSFGPGAEVTHWNGKPIENAVLENADREPGNNPASRLARGLARLTVRPLAFSLPPDEDWITVTYLPPGRPVGASSIPAPRRIMLSWGVWRGRSRDLFGRANESASVCESVAETHMARKALWCGDKNDSDARIRQFRAGVKVKGSDSLPRAAADHATNSDAVDLSLTSVFPEIFQFRIPVNRDDESRKRFAYVRIRNFDHAGEHSVSDFVEEFRRILEMAARQAPDGLILDIRGNPGGSVPAAESILQMLTPDTIEPERFHCINSPLMRRIAAKGPLDFMDLRFDFGRVLSNGKHLTRPNQANDIGQVYHGPTTLITDALCYSAADVFAAGFQDHAIGPVIGVDTGTGAGGANRWMHHELVARLRSLAPNPLEPLPDGIAMGVALRRSLRVGLQAGEPVEDVGVIPEIVRPLTANDVLGGNEDLIAFARETLAARPSHRLEIVEVEGRTRTGDTGPWKLRLTAATRGIQRLEAYLHGRPQLAVSVTKDPVTTTLEIPLPSEFTPFHLELKGFVFKNSAWVLVAARKRKLTTADRKVIPPRDAAAARA